MKSIPVKPFPQEITTVHILSENRADNLSGVTYTTRFYKTSTWLRPPDEMLVDENGRIEMKRSYGIYCPHCHKSLPFTLKEELFARVDNGALRRDASLHDKVFRYIHPKQGVIEKLTIFIFLLVCLWLPAMFAISLWIGEGNIVIFDSAVFRSFRLFSMTTLLDIAITAVVYPLSVLLGRWITYWKFRRHDILLSMPRTLRAVEDDLLASDGVSLEICVRSASFYTDTNPKHEFRRWNGTLANSCSFPTPDSAPGGMKSYIPKSGFMYGWRIDCE